MFKTRVRFKDGTEEIETWREDDHSGPAAALKAAITLAELQHGQSHDGAWLEFNA